ncbi:MAG: metallophosphoesterase [Tannerella sp.]|jgi:hypothetical protein|nr:metallophosphoesterase [Tannerella sp.]
MKLITSVLLLLLASLSVAAQVEPNQPDGPYIFYTDTGTVIVTVATDGLIHTEVYRDGLPPDFSFEVCSTAPEAGKDAPSRFKVRLRKDYKRIDCVRPAPDSLLVISDPHAKWTPFTSILKAQGVVDENLKWKYGKNELMIIGDIFDRGDDATTIFWFVYKLQQEAREAGGEVHFLYGNHEEMELRDATSCYRNGYLFKKYIALSEAYFGDSTHYGSRFFGVDTELGRWLMRCNTIQKIGADLFVHAGLNEEFYRLNYSPAEVNSRVSAEMFNPSRKSDTTGLLAAGAKGGVLWYRGMISGFNPESAPPLPVETLHKLLRRYKAERVIVGHTEVTSSSIAEPYRVTGATAYDGNGYDFRVVDVNVPTDRAFERGYGRGVLITRTGATFVVYDRAPNTPLPLPKLPLPK